MADQNQLELERAPVTSDDVHGFDGSPKTILVHIQDDETLDVRIETALSLARSFSAHVECLHVTPSQAYVAYDSLGGVFVMPDVIKAIEEGEAEIRSKIESKLANEDVNWNYNQVTGDVASQLISRAALADLLVTSRAPIRADFVGSTIGLLGDLICRSRTPVLIPGDGGRPCDPTKAALIAWDGSYEAANAVRSSIGMLKRASSVHVLQIVEEKAEFFPSTRLLEYLSQHGIHAELTIENVDAVEYADLIPEILVTRAKGVNAGYMVMGGYNHSRLGEFVFGGVTRTMLSASPVPILIVR
ncbi:universal stress protein [Sphingomonas sp.]|uniref:universal stress protein n=1 Tax=Sphingomonas sp. TaxID=28214 RepID=UPI0025EE666D|nr:universal stress protein [Sphingomonas sp.]